MCDDLRRAVERFVETSRQPVAIEPGEPPFPLNAGSYHLDPGAAGLQLQVWDEVRTLSRRLTGIVQARTGQLTLKTARFGGREGILELVDTSRPQSVTATRRAGRMTFRERFRRSLSRQFPGWRIAELSADLDLTRSLSPAFPRALLVRGREGWAAIGASREQNDPSAALSFGLIWLSHLRRREPQLTIHGLALFLPEEWERSTCFRVRSLNPARARFRIYSCSDAQELLVDPDDAGNLDTRLPVCHRRLEGPPSGMIEALTAVDGVEPVELNDGTLSLRVRGLEFARASAVDLRFGLERKHPAKPSDLPAIVELARGLSELRQGGASGSQNALRLRCPELWLEAEVRRAIQQIDASLRPAPIYTQAPTFASAERGIIDLLAVDIRGRMCVLELKASEELHLPLQALDYWMRVKWHLDRGEFEAAGYFPGITLQPQPPRLFLVAPSLQFHPSTETILSYFSSDVEVVRIGLGENWRQELKVVSRLYGAESRA